MVIPTRGLTIEVYYKNQFNSSYKTDEKVMNDIIGKNVKCVNDNDRLKLVIYYKSMTTKHRGIKVNLEGTFGIRPKKVC